MIDRVSSGGMADVQSLMRLGGRSMPAEEKTGDASETRDGEGESIEQLLAGKIRNVDEIVHRIAQADPTLQAMIRTRGKIASAYQEMMESQ